MCRAPPRSARSPVRRSTGSTSPGVRRPRPPLAFARWPTASASSPSTPTPTTRRPRAPAPWPGTTAEGVRTVLVCCTGGEAGDILNPAMDRPEVRADLPRGAHGASWRRSAEIIGYDEVVLLGYRDSGMPDSRANAHPEASPTPPLDEAVGRLVEVIRRERPQVIITYGDDQQGYPHPDHLRVHDISVAAFERAGDPDAVPRAGRAVAAAEALLLGLVARRASWRPTRRSSSSGSSRRSTRSGSSARRRTTASRPASTSAGTPTCASTRCWPTPPRSTPTSPFWFGLPREELRHRPPLRGLHAGPLAGRVRRCPRTTCSPASGGLPSTSGAARAGRSRPGRGPRPTGLPREQPVVYPGPAPDHPYLLVDGHVVALAVGVGAARRARGEPRRGGGGAGRRRGGRGARRRARARGGRAAGRPGARARVRGQPGAAVVGAQVRSERPGGAGGGRRGRGGAGAGGGRRRPRRRGLGPLVAGLRTR